MTDEIARSSTLDAIDAAASNLRALRTKLHDELAYWRDTFDRLRDQARTLAADNARLQTEANALRAELAQKTTALSAANARAEDFERLVEQYRARVADVQPVLPRTDPITQAPSSTAEEKR